MNIFHTNARREEAGRRGGPGPALFREQGTGYFLRDTQLSQTQKGVSHISGLETPERLSVSLKLPWCSHSQHHARDAIEVC